MKKQADNKGQNDMHDIVIITRFIISGRRIILRSILIFGIIGLLVAIFSPKEYTASTTIVPQSSDTKSALGGLSGLAAMAGFKLNSSGASELSPTLYPQILSSVTYQLELMRMPMNFEKIDQPISLEEYYSEYNKPSLLTLVKKYTIGLPGVLSNYLKASNNRNSMKDDENCIRLTENQRKICIKLNEQLTIDVNDKEGYIMLTGNMPEARLAAQLTHNAEVLLQKYITDFKVEKAMEKKNFIEQRFNEKKKEFETAQEALALFRDEHKNVTSALTRTKEERLTAEYNMLFGVYTELAKQLEQAQIQVKEDTPVFTIIDPVSIPNKKSKPKRGMILFVWLFLGCVVGIAIIFIQYYIKNLYNDKLYYKA